MREKMPVFQGKTMSFRFFDFSSTGRFDAGKWIRTRMSRAEFASYFQRLAMLRCSLIVLWISHKFRPRIQAGFIASASVREGRLFRLIVKLDK